MARYIDADKLLEQVNSLEQLARKRVYDTPTNSPAYERYATQYQEREKMLAILKAQPTADVAPKNEVAREVIGEIKNLLLPLVYLGADGKWHMVKPYASNLHSFVEGFLDLLDKYTEGET